MKSFYKNILLTFAGLIILIGCSKKWLELELKGVTPFNSETINTESKAFEVLCGAYDMLQVKYYSAWSSWLMIANLPSDDDVTVGGGYSDRPEYWDLDQFETTSENTAILQFWRRNYYGIYRANIVINELSLQSPTMDIYRAEAKYLRAYFYFELVRAFGDVVFYTKNLAPSEYKATNTPRATIYQQIETDLLEAIPVLPLKSQQKSSDYERVSKGAAQALLGKIYLYQKKYSDAIAQLDAVINSKEYDLCLVYDSVFTASEEFGIESVFEIPYKSYTHGAAGAPWIDGREGEGNIDAQLCGPRETSIPGLAYGGWGFDMLDSSLIDAWDAEGDIIRKYATGIGPDSFIVLNIPNVDSTTDLNGNGFPDNKEQDEWTGWYQLKHSTLLGTNAPYDATSVWTYNTNDRVIRFSDILLMAAEAYNQGSISDDKARTYLNKVRARVNLAAKSTSGSALFDDIKLERRLELAAEGHRFYDLVRWGDAPLVLGPLGFVEGKNELFPIPEVEIGLSNLKQNPGY